jgi:hypothetical protein
MSTSNNGENRYASGTQLLLAKLYRYVSIIGLFIMAAALILYVSGLLETNIPAGEVRSYWHLEAGVYAAETDTPVGWDFIKELSRGDSLSFGSLVFMAVAVIVCLIIMIVAFLRRQNKLFALIALLQTIVLVLAASGLVSGH